MNELDIADLSVIVLTYKEPQKEEFWIKIKNLIPWAQRVDGVKGSDSAHKAAAAASETERFVLIDGDNLPDIEFFDMSLQFPDTLWQQAVYRWRARNYINGLIYGNGGLSSWTKTYANNMRTHENSSGDDQTAVEFCFDKLYWPMHDCYSTTYPNYSQQQAWQAGFREGVKLCLNKGQKPSMSEFRRRVHHRNLDHLTIWHNVGADVENGLWAIAGSRMGTSYTMLENWDYRQVQSFDYLDDLWSTIKQQSVEDLIEQYQRDLKSQLDLPMNLLSPDHSKFFKHHYHSNWRNRGIMLRECDA
jgi:hypothetical protein